MDYLNSSHIEDGYAGIKKNSRVKAVNVLPPSRSALVRHKYKCDIGKKSYTFKNKKDLSSTLGLSRTNTNKLIKGELASDKIKINLI